MVPFSRKSTIPPFREFMDFEIYEFTVSLFHGTGDSSFQESINLRFHSSLYSPFHGIVHPSFHRFMNTLNPGFTIP